MKTLTFFLLLFGVFCTTTSYSYTILNLPVEGTYISPVDNLFVDGTPGIILEVNNEKPRIETKQNFEDTIVIDLEEVVITDGFPSQSQDCLRKFIKYPAFASKEKLEGVVAMQLMFDPNGNVQILDSFGSDPRFEKYVHGQIVGLQPKNCSVEIGKEYNLRIAFRLY